jgi:asparagine synthase (glutamine-hydrolysing)
MCGITGFFDFASNQSTDRQVLERITEKLSHRGPDSRGYFLQNGIGFGFRRLSILDLEAGDQPMFNEDCSVVSVCNGEFYNYRELRRELEGKKHQFISNCDSEILPHLYEEYGIDLVHRLNGQFAFAIYDIARRRLYLARDHFGINPLFYTVFGGTFLFASEIKSLLEHPKVCRSIDLTGLDQIFSFPGLVSPSTMFKNIKSLGSGQYITVTADGFAITEFWDLNYPIMSDVPQEKEERFIVEHLSERLMQSVSHRLQSDVPVGIYLSGGLDSSVVASIVQKLSPHTQRHTFSISFLGKEMCESKHQTQMAQFINSIHHDIQFESVEISRRLEAAIYHAESPLKETYNTACLALSETAKANGITVILTGQGADELFAGYVGYRFDQLRLSQPKQNNVEELIERQIREQLWGDPTIAYDGNYLSIQRIKSELYSEHVLGQFDDFNCLRHCPIRKDRLQGRHFIHKRSYLDFKLRLADHLLSDHGDRMAMANSVELRHPFLDIDLVNFTQQIPPDLKLKGFNEKYILKEMAQTLVPPEILKREKFGWFAFGSPELLQARDEYVCDHLSYSRIKRQGYFNPDKVEQLKSEYSRAGFQLNRPLETDLLAIVLTFSIFLDLFHVGNVN